MAPLVTVVVAALLAGVLLRVGVCPLTIQMLVLSLVLCAAFLRTWEPATAMEHMTTAQAEPDMFEPPAADLLTHRLEPMLGGVAAAKSIRDDAAGGAFESQLENARDDALVLSSEPWRGPPSNLAGVFADFTIAATVTLPEAAQVSLFRAQAMTAAGGLGVVELAVQPSAEGRRQLALLYGGAVVSAAVAATKEPVTIVCRRAGLKVTLLQSVHSVTAGSERAELDLDDAAKARPQVTSPVVVGAAVAGGDALLSRLLVWKGALTDEQLAVVVKQGLTSQLLKEQVYGEMKVERDAARARAREARSLNPFGSEGVQAACAASVPDWTAPGELAFASVACRAAIEQHCKANPTAKGCECFGDAARGTPDCRKFLAMMRSAPPADLENLSQAELAAIVAQYRLVDPKAQAEAAAAAATAMPAAPLKRPVARRRILTNHLEDDENRLMSPGFGYFGQSAAYDQHDARGRYGPTQRKRGWWWWFFGQ